MSARNVLALGLAAFLFSSSLAHAKESEILTLVKKKGFTGCDSLVESTLSKVVDGSRFNVDWFEETSHNTIGVTATYGTTNDTVLVDVIFSKAQGYCYARIHTAIAEQGNCGALLQNNQYFAYKGDGGGALWSQNKGGVNNISFQNESTCVQTYIKSDKVKATK